MLLKPFFKEAVGLKTLDAFLIQTLTYHCLSQEHFLYQHVSHKLLVHSAAWISWDHSPAQPCDHSPAQPCEHHRRWTTHQNLLVSTLGKKWWMEHKRLTHASSVRPNSHWKGNTIEDATQNAQGKSSALSRKRHWVGKVEILNGSGILNKLYNNVYMLAWNGVQPQDQECYIILYWR